MLPIWNLEDSRNLFKPFTSKGGFTRFSALKISMCELHTGFHILMNGTWNEVRFWCEISAQNPRAIPCKNPLSEPTLRLILLTHPFFWTIVDYPAFFRHRNFLLTPISYQGIPWLETEIHGTLAKVSKKCWFFLYKWSRNIWLCFLMWVNHTPCLK